MNIKNVIIIFVLFVDFIYADTHYVAINSSNPVSPYTNWFTAATIIQDSVNAAKNGDVVLVSNGVYKIGSSVTPGYSSLNRVVITNDVIVRSVNGSSFTFIEGAESSDANGGNGDGAIRCVYMNKGGLSGFTLTNGHTLTNGDIVYDQCGGGINMFHGNAIVSNCVITSNACEEDGGGSFFGFLNNCKFSGNKADTGGGSFMGTLNNCVLTSNSAVYAGGNGGGTLNNCVLKGNIAVIRGGGSEAGVLSNCTLTENTAYAGGGSYFGELNNSINYNNNAAYFDNYYNSDLSYCCTFPMPDEGTGNITNNPILVNYSHISVASPCIGMGSASYSTGVDIDGQAWLETPSIGCDEPLESNLGNLEISTATNMTVAINHELILTADIQGEISRISWVYGDGNIDTNGSYITTHTWDETGLYDVVVTVYNNDNPTGVSSSFEVKVIEIEYFVNISNNFPIAPYTNWATAADNIQEAVNVAIEGCTVWVSNGVYDKGVSITPGHSSSNRVIITKDITVKSLNGPAVTVISGSESIDMDGGNGTGAVRCVYMNKGVLSGFTLTKGHTLEVGYIHDTSGGGVNMFNGDAIVSNCIIISNSAINGGGCYDGELYNCILTGNSATNGGAGVNGVYKNCTITDNSALNVGGSYSGFFNECIVYKNLSPTNANYYRTLMSHSCTYPMPQSGFNNITNDPRFVSSDDFKLSADSPCIDAGKIDDWMYRAKDLLGIPRILNKSVDIGAYEFGFKANLKVLLEGGVE